MAANTERRLAVEQILASPSPLQLFFSTASFLCCKAAPAGKTHVANRNKLANVRQATAWKSRRIFDVENDQQFGPAKN